MSTIIEQAKARQTIFADWIETVLTSKSTVHYTIGALFAEFGHRFYKTEKAMSKDWRFRIANDSRVHQQGISTIGYFIASVELHLQLPPLVITHKDKGESVRAVSQQSMIYDFVVSAVLSADTNLMIEDIAKDYPITLQGYNFATYFNREHKARQQAGDAKIEVQTVPRVGTIVAPLGKLVQLSPKRKYNQAQKAAKAGRQSGCRYVAHANKRYIGKPVDINTQGKDGYIRLKVQIPTAFLAGKDCKDVWHNEARPDEFLVELKDNKGWLLFSLSK